MSCHDLLSRNRFLHIILIHFINIIILTVQGKQEAVNIVTPSHDTYVGGQGKDQGETHEGFSLGTKFKRPPKSSLIKINILKLYFKKSNLFLKIHDEKILKFWITTRSVLVIFSFDYCSTMVWNGTVIDPEQGNRANQSSYSQRNLL